MSKSISILFLTSWYPTPEYPTHGIFIRNHAKALALYCPVVVLYVYASTEIQEVVIEHTSSQNLEEYVLAFPKSKIPFLKRGINLFKYFYYYYQLSKLVKKHHLSVSMAQINVPYPVAFYFPVIKFMLNIQSYTVFEQWTGYLSKDNFYKGFLRKYVTSKCLQHAKRVWCLCHEQKEAMQAHHLRASYDILGNVVNTHLFVPKPKPPHSKKRFLHISTLDDRQKNIRGILRVFRELETAGYAFELIVVGGKAEAVQSAQEMARHLGLQQVCFKGIVPQDLLPEYYQQADALVMFSNYETFCVVVYEALSCGTYVITTAVADLDKVISEEFGILVPPKNEHALKQAILKVIHHNTSCNAQLAHQFIKENFSAEVIGKKFYEHYCSLAT